MLDVLNVALQLLVVTTGSWDSVQGQLLCYERNSPKDMWQLVLTPVDIAVGKNGMAWGKGLPFDFDLSGIHKKEGDGKAPAGIFSLRLCFGDEKHRRFAKNMAYLLVDDDLECVDDPNSRYYNQFVHANSILDKDWKSSEPMLKIGHYYTLGIVVDHNVDPIEKGVGSCIFIHIARDMTKGSGGCTIMEEQKLIEVVSWLDAKKHPLLVQLPISEYKHVRLSDFYYPCF